MFASCCISGAGDFDTSICKVPMVIRKYFSIRNKYWPEDQQFLGETDLTYMEFQLDSGEYCQAQHK